MNQVKISQCMIVKDEEENIQRALSWGKCIMSEQIVVDTGSTDRTVEIARQLGAKVYHFSWVDDFSAAKNFAISKARYEWIALLDADEYFSEEDAKKLPLLLANLKNTPYDGLATNWIHLDDNGSIGMIDTQVRIFRNCPGLRYHRKIHEYLAWEDDKGISYRQDTEGLSLFHTGYGEAAKKKKQRGGRNLKLILAELKDHPDDFEMLTYLGNEYVGLEEYALAEETYREVLSRMPKWTHGVYHVAASEVPLRLLSVMVDQPNTKESDLLEIYEKAVTGWPEEGDYDYFVGLYYSRHGNYSKAEPYIRRGLEIMEKYGNYQKSMILSGKITQAYELLSVCCLNNGNLRETVRLTTVMLNQNPYLMGTLILFMIAFRSEMETTGEEKWGALQVASLLEKSFYDFTSLKDRMFVLRAAESAEYQELIQILRGLFSEEELKALDRA
ncbi:MAG: glycosyltransferase [Hungatella sp.]|nr:glycosyltransferase [Hungatella sp.]